MVHRLVLEPLAALLALMAPGLALTTEAQPLTEEAWERALPANKPRTGVPLAAGRVVAINRNADEITLEHRPIPHLYMEYMTMMVRVAEHSMLEGLRPGDKVRFALRRDSGRYVIVWIENSN